MAELSDDDRDIALNLSESNEFSGSQGDLQSTKGKPRTTNACEPCRRRKTKCSGRPGPCDACTKHNSQCRFDVQPESRRRASRVANLQDPQQYLLNGILQVLKHSDEKTLSDLINSLRHNHLPQAIADNLRQNLEVLQRRGLIATTTIEEEDLVALATKCFDDELMLDIPATSALGPGQPVAVHGGHFTWINEGSSMGDTSTSGEINLTSASEMRAPLWAQTFEQQGTMLNDAAMDDPTWQTLIDPGHTGHALTSPLSYSVTQASFAPSYSTAFPMSVDATWNPWPSMQTNEGLIHTEDNILQDGTGRPQDNERSGHNPRLGGRQNQRRS